MLSEGDDGDLNLTLPPRIATCDDVLDIDNELSDSSDADDSDSSDDLPLATFNKKSLTSWSSYRSIHCSRNVQFRGNTNVHSRQVHQQRVHSMPS